MNNILILHGWGANKSRFDGLIDLLGKKGYCALAIDLPGFGSEPPPDKIWGIADYANWVSNKAHEIFPEGYILFGHSFGGQIAMRVASDFSANMKALILIAPAGVRLPPTTKVLVLNKLAQICGMALQLFGVSGSKTILSRFWRRVSGSSDYANSFGIMREIMRKIIREDQVEFLKHIKIPVLLLWGENDKSAPYSEHSIYLHELANVSLVTFPTGGHNFIYQAARWVSDEIEKFLSERLT